MANISEVKLESNKKVYLEAFEQVVDKILTEIGMEAETAAKMLAPVDTGLLRNSITWAIGGQSANIDSYHADHEKNGEKASGSYSGTAEADKEGEHSVHIGTNVEYAMAQETGTFKDGAHAFLRPAINDNIDHFREIIENELKACDPE